MIIMTIISARISRAENCKLVWIYFPEGYKDIKVLCLYSSRPEIETGGF
jgi:hypothetical protein